MVYQTQIVASFSEQCRISRQLDILDSHQQEMDAALLSLIADLERIQRYVGNSTLMVSGY